MTLMTSEQWQAEQDAIEQCQQQSPWLQDSAEPVTYNREVPAVTIASCAQREVEMAVAFAKSCLENERAMESQVARLHKALADMHPDRVPDWEKEDYRRAVNKALGLI
jgi:hypothetical protein